MMNKDGSELQVDVLRSVSGLTDDELAVTESIRLRQASFVAASSFFAFGYGGQGGQATRMLSNSVCYDGHTLT